MKNDYLLNIENEYAIKVMHHGNLDAVIGALEKEYGAMIKVDFIGYWLARFGFVSLAVKFEVK
ncbi:hypothetical protein [Shewanella sp.]|uniref:hypothetical protein n=1 Tax=Shewanella sp. TaxID=50422 RepID=UPI0035617DD1